MAITPKAYLVSPLTVYDTNTSDYIHLLVGSGAPSGGVDPCASAYQGSLYFRADASDDEPCLYVKVDSDSSDDDWVALLIDKDEATKTIEAIWTWSADAGICFRDSDQKFYSPSDGVVAWYINGTSDAARIGDSVGGNYLQIAQDGELTLVGNAMVNQRYRFEMFDDFIQQTLTEADTPWILNSGSDAEAIDPAISAQECGVLRLTTGDDDGTTAKDASQVVCHIPVQADSGGLVFETRLHINTAVTNVSVCAGLTDSTSLEEPFSIGAADAITSTATDAACFCYDTSADTDEWFMLAVDSDSDDTGNATTGTAPVADTYQTLRIEVASDGNTVRYYIDGTLEGTLTNAGVTETANLYATVIACGDGTASKTVDVDYIYVGHKR